MLMTNKKKKELPLAAKVGIILAIVVILAICYIFLFKQPMDSKIAKVEQDIELANDELTIQTTKNARLKQMQTFLEDPENLKSEVVSYDNLNNIMLEINEILNETENFSVSFGTPITTDGLNVRRSMTISCSCKNYPQAYGILKRFNDSPLRKLMTAFSVTADGGVVGSDSLQDAGLNGTSAKASVNINLTYFETLDGVDETTIKGITLPKKQTITEEDIPEGETVEGYDEDE